jgi:two-component system, response regulator
VSVRTILLIEDNPDDEALIVRSLRRNSIVNPIHVARDGAEALEYLFRDPAAPGPGIILLDLRLPKVDGLEILRQIRATPATKTLPVAVLTSSEDEMDALVSQGCGADAILAKPLEFQDFRDVLQTLGLESLIAGPQSGSTEASSPERE